MAACATSRPRTLAERFIVPGTPAIDVGGSARPDGPRPAPPPRQAPAPRPRSTIDLPTLESTSPLLRARLAALEAHRAPATHLALAAAYRAYGVDDRAFDVLARGLVDFPQSGTLHDAVARHWRDWGFPDRGLRHAHLAVRFAPKSAAAHTTLGTILWALSAERAGLAAFRRAYDLAPAAGFARHNVCRAERNAHVSHAAVCPPPSPEPEP